MSFHLGFDARMYGLKHAGIGRYIENVVRELVHSPAISRLTLFLPPDLAKSLPVPDHVTKIPVVARHYTLKEQIAFPYLLFKHPVDLLHFPHFNVPLLFNRPYVVTIHDILWHRVRGEQVTTLNPLIYYPKYLGYRQVVRHAVTAARGIIVPSNFVKHDVLSVFTKVPAAKIKVIYEGVTPLSQFKISNLPAGEAGFKFKIPYILYIGSAYPHKNIPIIFPVLKQLDLHLVVIGSRSIFLDRLKENARQAGVGDRVTFLGYQPDEAMAGYLAQAVALVQPSLSEGFGLTGLEAMAQGCPVIAARTSCLPEIYAEAALYFSPHDPQDLARQLKLVRSDQTLRANVIARGRAHAERFTWSATAQATIASYRSVLARVTP